MKALKVTNNEIYELLNKLIAVQNEEKKYEKETGKKLFCGKIKICYAISHNMEEMKRKITCCNSILEELQKEYRDIEKEQAAVQKEKEEAEKEKRAEKSIRIILRDGKSLEEYQQKIKELGEIENELSIYTVPIDLMDGIELNSEDISRLDFMLTEE